MEAFVTEDGDLMVPAEVVASTSEVLLIREITKAIKAGLIRFPLRRYLGISALDLLAVQPNTAQVKDYGQSYGALIPDWIGDYGSHYLFDTRAHCIRPIVCLYNLHDYNTLNQITDLFTENARLHAVVRGQGAPIKTWCSTQAESIASCCVRYAKKNQKQIDLQIFSASVFLGGVRMCTNFKVSVAQAIYEYFDARVVFDGCSGWGDRALGALRASCVTEYYGCDPNVLLREGYDGIQELASTVGKKVTLVTSPVESFEYDDGSKWPRPDFIFSSPPFYDLEDYVPGCGSQSLTKYALTGGFISWLNGWFLPQFVRQLRYLQVGGRLVYYLTNTGSNDIITPMIKTGETTPGIVYDGAIPNLCGEPGHYRYPVFFFVFRKISDTR